MKQKKTLAVEEKLTESEECTKRKRSNTDFHGLVILRAPLRFPGIGSNPVTIQT